MRHATDIIIKPIVSERTTSAVADGKYTFKVAIDATKIEIRQAVEKLFNVKVVAVNTLHVGGKNKRVGVHAGKTPAWKKAVVTIDTEPKANAFMQKGGKTANATKKYETSIDEFGFGQ